MQSAKGYLSRTESAVRRLFDGIESYISILNAITGVTFVTSEPHSPAQDAEYAAWKVANARKLAAAKAAEREYLAESFALNTLCGAVLQVAGKAIEIYGQNKEIPEDLRQMIKPGLSRFCVGRLVRTVPIGLIIYAARNQHTHFNDEALREPSASIFKLLATKHGYGGSQEIVDPAFDLNNHSLLSFASNVTSLIGWRSYDNYLSDMSALMSER